jgi:hypothetical protein
MRAWGKLRWLTSAMLSAQRWFFRTVPIMVVKNLKYSPHATWMIVLKSNTRNLALQLSPHIYNLRQDISWSSSCCLSSPKPQLISTTKTPLISWNNITNHVNHTERWSWVYFSEYLEVELQALKSRNCWSS